MSTLVDGGDDDVDDDDVQHDVASSQKRTRLVCGDETQVAQRSAHSGVHTQISQQI